MLHPMDSQRRGTDPELAGLDQADWRMFAGAVTALAIDLVTGEVTRAFEAASVSFILLKGPSIAGWLYPEDGHRTYCDSDLLVPVHDLKRAEAVLSDLGFIDPNDGYRHPGVGVQWMRHHAGTRMADNVDLHTTLNGLSAAPEAVWMALSAQTESLRVGGVVVPTLTVVPQAMHLALHAALSGIDVPRPTADLARGLAQLALEVWTQARDLAASLDGIPVFAAGLRRLPEGAAVADQLGLPTRPPTEITLLAGSRPPGALSFSALHSLAGVGAKARYLAYRLAPSAYFMRTRFPRACHGPLGVFPAYPLLWAQYVRKAPRGYRAWRRAGRR